MYNYLKFYLFLYNFINYLNINYIYFHYIIYLIYFLFILSLVINITISYYIIINSHFHLYYINFN